MKIQLLLASMFLCSGLAYGQSNTNGPDTPNSSPASVQQVAPTESNFWVYQSGNNVTLSTSNPPKNNMMVDVYDVAGRLVMRTNWDRYQTTKQLGDVGYARGLYIIKLKEDNIYHVIKWMKN